MKAVVKAVNLLIVGLAVAVFIYPMLHELGHSVFALCVGSEVLDVTLFPFPSVVCCMDTQKDIAVALVGFGGMLLRFFPLYR